MDYCVDISVEGFYRWDGKASSKEDAVHKAIDACTEEDFGPLSDIDFNVYQVEREK